MMSKILLAFILSLPFLNGISSAQMKLNGAGATFPYVIYSKWFDVIHQKTGIEFNYQAIGASDAPMTDEQMKQVKEKQGTDILHIPTVMGAVVVTYNLINVGKELKLIPDVLADIYLGKIAKWNDSRITSINS